MADRCRPLQHQEAGAGGQGDGLTVGPASRLEGVAVIAVPTAPSSAVDGGAVNGIQLVQGILIDALEDLVSRLSASLDSLGEERIPQIAEGDQAVVSGDGVGSRGQEGQDQFGPQRANVLFQGCSSCVFSKTSCWEIR